MTPKEKAQELFDKMYLVDDPMGNYPMCFDTAKQCALIAVNEIIKSNPHSNPFNTYGYSTMAYWNEVKHEIEKAMMTLLKQIEYWKRNGNFNFELYLAVCKAKEYTINIDTKQKVFRYEKKKISNK